MYIYICIITIMIVMSIITIIVNICIIIGRALEGTQPLARAVRVRRPSRQILRQFLISKKTIDRNPYME